jgi:hypothetical protein
MSTQVSSSAAELTPAADAGRPPPAAPGAVRSTSWRLYAALAFASLVLAALSLLYPSTPSYDPWGWLLWGREILHLKLNTVGANSFKPLPVLLTLPFALFGKAQPDLWLVVARAGVVFALAMAFRLAARMTIWFGASPAGRQGVSRVVAYGPAILAGGIAALTMLMSPEFIRNGALGYSECWAVGLVLLAVERHLDDKPREAFIIGFFPALDRPEIWAFWGLYGLYLWRRDPGARRLVVAMFALVPALWFLPEYWGSGHFFRGVTRALHPRNGAATFAKCPFCSEMKQAYYVTLVRVMVVAAVMAVGAAIAIWRALRRRTEDLGVAVRKQAHRPEGIVLVLAVTAILWFVEISTMTQMGFGGNQRYLVIGGALVAILGGVGWGLAAWKLGGLLARWIRRPAPGAAVAVIAATALFVFVPGWVGAHFQAHQLDQALRYQAQLRDDLNAIIQKAGGAKAVLACGKVETENYQVPIVAWYLGVEAVQISDEMPPSVAKQGANVILQTRVTGTAQLRPVIPSGVHYTEIKQRTFRLFEHCR